MNTRASGLPLASPKSNPGVSKKRGKKKGNILIQTPPGFGPFSPVKFEDITSSERGGSATGSEVEELVCEDKLEPQPAMDPLDMSMHRRAAAVAVPATRGSATDETCFMIDVFDDLDWQEILEIEASLEEELKDEKIEEVEIEVKEELKLDQSLRIKSSIEKPPTDLELKPLPVHLEYAFLEDVQEMREGKIAVNDEEDEELEDFDPILKRELTEFEKFNPHTKHETSDPDLVLLELEYLINNSGAFLSLAENCQGISHDPFDLFSLTCQGKENILQEFEDIGNDTSQSEFKKNKFNESKCDDMCEFAKRRDDGVLFSEAREWYDAWVKRNKMFDVGKEALIFGDNFGHEPKEEIVRLEEHVGKKDERYLDLYIKA